MRFSSPALAILSVASFTACAPGAELFETPAEGDERGDLAVGVCRAVRAANVVDDDAAQSVGADALAAIIAWRAGADGEIDTRDDRWFDSADALANAVPAERYEEVLGELDAFAELHGITCGRIPVQLLAFDDFHGHLEPPTGGNGRVKIGPSATDTVEAGGVEYLATHIAMRRAMNARTLVVAAGDLIGGAPFLSSALRHEPAIEALGALGLDYAAVGNHEFDGGREELLRLQRGARFQYLAANVIDTATNATILPPFAVRTFDGVPLAVIGMTLEGTPLHTNGAGIIGLEFRDEAVTANAIVAMLRERGVHAFVVLIHEGVEHAGLYNECVAPRGELLGVLDRLDRDVSIVVSGHTHHAYDCDLGGRLVTAAMHGGRILTDIDLTLSSTSGRVIARDAENIIVTRDVPRDEVASAIIASAKARALPIGGRVIASIDRDYTRETTAAGESALGDLIADALLASSSGAPEPAQIAFMNPGGIRADLTYASQSNMEAPGEVTYAEAFVVQPFGDNLITMTLTGAQIERVLEEQWRPTSEAETKFILQVSRGFAYSYDRTRPIGDRVDPSRITLDGAPIEPFGSYRVTVNSFLAFGGDGFATFRDGTDRTSGGGDLEAFERLLASGSVQGAPRDRISRLPD